MFNVHIKRNFSKRLFDVNVVRTHAHGPMVIALAEMDFTSVSTDLWYGQHIEPSRSQKQQERQPLEAAAAFFAEAKGTQRPKLHRPTPKGPTTRP